MNAERPNDTLADQIRAAAAEIADLIQWADRQGFQDIAAELRDALALLPSPESKDQRRDGQPSADTVQI
jgi:hypothetical protein